MKPSASSEPVSGRAGPALLVAQTSFLGDVVLTTPLLAELRTSLRPRRLAVLVRPEAAPLLAGHPAVDDVLIDDKRGRDRGLRGLARVARRLRRERFDLAVSPRLHLAVDPGAAARAAALLPTGPEPLVGIAPGSVWATKRWTPTGFAAVAAALDAEGARCVLLGSSADAPLVEAIQAASGGRALALAGRTDVATLVAVIDRLSLLIANDSAPMHVACARGIPVVAVFCATTPALGYGPWGAGHTVIGAELACRPCARHGGQRCPRGTEDCMHLVEPAAVLAAARRALAARVRA